MKAFIAPAPARVPHRGRLYVARDVLPASRRPSLSPSRRARESGFAFELQRLADRLCKRNHFCGAPCWPNRRPVSIEMVMARSLTPTAVQGQDAGTVQSPNALPDRLRDVEPLEEVMTMPSAALIAALQELPGDIIILGVGGKIGPTLARLAKRAAPGKRVVGVARFSEKGVREKLAGGAIECVEADLLERKQIDALPKLPNVVFMAGRKFGSSGHEDLTWAMNALVPAMVADAFASSRIVTYSTGCVYPYVNVHHGGATETTPTTPPPGAYANSCVAREAMFQYFSRTRGTPGRIIRLNYAIDMRYGVLHDVAMRVLAGTPINLTTGHVNVIWQGDANAMVLRAFTHCTVPTSPLNVSGPETVSIRWLAESFAQRLGQPPIFTGVEGSEAWLVNTAEATRLFGYPSVPLGKVIDWTADLVARGMPSLGKDTHYDTPDGQFSAR